jgi:exopolysaccharide biosynthesis protein
MSKKQIATRISMLLFLIIGGVSYLLADRYLIQHVEIVNVVAAATADATSALLPDNVSLIGSANITEAVATQTVVADDWNYQSGEVSISIREESMSSGNNKVTYFVADVVLTDATQLTSAFAGNSFGRNIIACTSEIASENDAVFAINGDYYGFRTNGIEIRNGIIYRDIPARIGLAFYLDGSMKIYDETQTSAQQLLDEGVWNTLSFGPALIENNGIVPNLGAIEIDTNFGNHSIQGNNPRTGVGIIDDNHLVFVVVDGRSAGYSRGVSLAEFAQIFKDLGCSDAYNIDGGGSSTLYFMGRVVNNPLGRNAERGTSDILFING